MNQLNHKNANSRMDAALRSGGVSSSAIYSAAMAAARTAAEEPADVLDFGSGTGQLLPLLRTLFTTARLHGADIMPRPVGLLNDATWHEGDLNLAVPVPDASFDLICAVEVIEHLENPRHTIREIARMLRKCGCAVLTTPNTESIKSLLTFASRGHHAQFDDSNYPAHITALSSIDLARMAQEAGLTCERIFYTDHGTVPKLLHYHWQAIPVAGNFARGRRFSDNFGVVLRKPD